MKKSVCLLISILLVMALCAACRGTPNAAYGDVVPYSQTDSDRETLFPFQADNGDKLSMLNVTSNGSNVGVYFGGAYFSAAGIPIDMYVYTNPTHDLGFNVNGSALTSAQTAERETLVQLFKRVHSFIREVDDLANTSYDGSNESVPTSDVYKYNNIEKFGRQTADGYVLQIDEHTYEMLKIAQEMYTATEGAFNPAVYRLVDLWGFSSRVYSNAIYDSSFYTMPYDRKVGADVFFSRDTGGGYPLPDQKYVKAFSDPAFTDFSDKAVHLSLENGNFYVTKRVEPVTVDGVSYSQWIDLGGIAKGYVVDCIRAMMREEGFDRVSVNAGGSSMGYGKGYDGKSFDLGIESAFNMYFSFASICVADCSVSTSGQYVRKYYVDGVEYSHILDGVSGEPAQTGVKAVTVVVPDGEMYGAAKSDCLTTALTVMGRTGIVDYANYLKENGLDIKIVGQYETLDGKKQLLTNCTTDELVSQDGELEQLGWALKLDENGVFYYDANAQFKGKTDVYKVLLIVLGCLLGAALIALVIYHFVKGRNRTLSNVRHAKKDKPFRMGDLAVYVVVALVIVVLFCVFVFDSDKNAVQLVTVIDEQTGETLFVYNPVRNELVQNDDNFRNWKIEVKSSANGVTVRFSCEMDGEERFNELKITRGNDFSVKMIDSRCGYHQDCVKNFPALTKPNGAIVCSPNRLKVVTA